VPAIRGSRTPSAQAADEASDLSQILCCDVGHKERGFDAVALRKMMKLMAPAVVEIARNNNATA
jgi:hypothetical protein